MAVPLPNGTQSLVPTVDYNSDASPRTGAPITTYAAAAASINQASLTSSGAGARAYLQGFAVTGGGATAASIIDVTVAWAGTSFLFKLVIPAGATTSINPLIVNFPTPLGATNDFSNVTVTAASFGAGNTNACVTAWGFRA